MEWSRARHGRVRTVVCLLIGFVSWIAGARSARAEGEEPPDVLVFPARASGSRPITVVLHGMCGAPENACRHFAEQVTQTENLICPRASERCSGGGSIWPAAHFAEQIAAAVERGKALLPEGADESHGRTLIGYSLGGFRALEIAQSSGGQYRRVMLIGARIYPSLELLRKNGVERLLFVAGEQDMTFEHMRQQSRQLSGAGFPASFLGLGPVGHYFTPSFERYLPRALSWLHA